MDTILSAITEYLKGCPVFDSKSQIYADYLPEKIDSYSIEGSPTSTIVQRYINGDSKRAYNFVIAGREPYGEDIIINLANAGFYERIADWMDDQTRQGNLPMLTQGKTAIKIEALSSGYISEEGTQDARYQIQCRLIYTQKLM